MCCEHLPLNPGTADPILDKNDSSRGVERACDPHPGQGSGAEPRIKTCQWQNGKRAELVGNSGYDKFMGKEREESCRELQAPNHFGGFGFVELTKPRSRGHYQSWAELCSLWIFRESVKRENLCVQ